MSACDIRTQSECFTVCIFSARRLFVCVSVCIWYVVCPSRVCVMCCVCGARESSQKITPRPPQFDKQCQPSTSVCVYACVCVCVCVGGVCVCVRV